MKPTYKLGLGILGIALFVFLTIYLAKDSKDIFLDVLKIGLGFLGGWGAGTYKKNNSK